MIHSFPVGIRAGSFSALEPALEPEGQPAVCPEWPEQFPKESGGLGGSLGSPKRVHTVGIPTT